LRTNARGGIAWAWRSCLPNLGMASKLRDALGVVTNREQSHRVLLSCAEHRQSEPRSGRHFTRWPYRSIGRRRLKMAGDVYFVATARGRIGAM